MPPFSSSPPTGGSSFDRSFQELRCGNDGLRDLGDLALLVHRRLAQERVGLLLRRALGLHQDAFGAVNGLALLQRGLGAVKLVMQTGDRAKAQDAQLQNALDALLPETVD